MPAVLTSQESAWNNNVYVLATTRVLMMIGVAYLVKSLYTLIPLIWGTRSASVAAVVADGIDLGAIVSDALVTAPGAADAGPDLEANSTLEVHPPQPVYDSQNHTERPWANAQALYQSPEDSGQSATAQTMPQHEVGLRNTDDHIEENIDITIRDSRRQTAAELAANKEFDGSATRPPGHAIGPSINARA